MRCLYILYDSRCGLCSETRRWMESRPKLVDLDFVPKHSSRAARIFPTLTKIFAQDELLVVSDEGAVYRGDRAYIMCLYALEEYRPWAFRLAAPSLRPFSASLFALLSKSRRTISSSLGLVSDTDLLALLSREPQPATCDRQERRSTDE